MTERCHHEIEIKPGYPDDRICMNCQNIWYISECMKMTATQLARVPMAVRREVMHLQAKALMESELGERIE